MFGGIVVSFSNVQLLDEKAKIFDQQPEFHFRVLVDFLIFDPAPGKKLVGVVNLLGDDHIGLLVWDFWAASITSEYIPSTYEYSEVLERWQDKENKDQVIEIGTELTFEVRSLNVARRMISINGTLIFTEKQEEEQKEEEEKIKKPKTKKRKKKKQKVKKENKS
eukprot:CAMPEP_0174258478 /NCGR_PEP_ID=MMETSP0439-20130205/7461_1 /TAXON_ID=0 /ORGANISM="Stereomyxa ramosa, Strain Chinc5" /LENGTH=163 /DNA_ID=CAMNT_0015341997 /DNA_START=165 /DNA_END=656 /DNA_ORIENTATION=-